MFKLNNLVSSVTNVISGVLPVDGLIDVAVPVLRKGAMAAETISNKLEKKADHLLEVKAERARQQAKESVVKAAKDTFKATKATVGGATVESTGSQKLWILFQILKALGWAVLTIASVAVIVGAFKVFLVPGIMYLILSLTSLVHLNFGIFLLASLYSWVSTILFGFIVAFVLQLWAYLLDNATSTPAPKAPTYRFAR